MLRRKEAENLGLLGQYFLFLIVKTFVCDDEHLSGCGNTKKKVQRSCTKFSFVPKGETHTITALLGTVSKYVMRGVINDLAR